MQSAVVAALLVLAAGTDPEPSRPTTAAELAKLARAYHVDIVTDGAGFPVQTLWGRPIDGKCADENDLKQFVPILVKELSLYPRAFAKRSKLQRIVLCKDLTIGKQRTPGGLTDWEHNTIYFNIAVLCRGDKQFQALAIHHEVLHSIDWSNERKSSDDDRWSALNATDFKYGTGGGSALNDPTTLVLSDEYPGFLNHYSTTFVAEDKAEVYANLVVEANYVAARIKKDAILRAKVDQVKGLVASVCPEMKGAFWDKSRDVPRPATEYRPSHRIPSKQSILYVGP